MTGLSAQARSGGVRHPTPASSGSFDSGRYAWTEEGAYPGAPARGYPLPVPRAVACTLPRPGIAFCPLSHDSVCEIPSWGSTAAPTLQERWGPNGRKAVELG